MRFNNLSEWLKWQETLHFKNIELGLDRCTKIGKIMGLLNPGFTVVSVGGTNGKGSSIAMLDIILRNAGYKTGCYTSPHFIQYNERIKINGVCVSDEMLCESFARIDDARIDVSLTYFEFGTLAALDIFHHADIDIALLEVGLGGRFDAVNCVDADVALISSIDLDHMEWLGKDREAIGYEKAGIFRSNKPAVCSDPCPPKILREYADQHDVEFYNVGEDFYYQSTGDSWSWQWDSITYQDLVCPAKYNSCQVQNAAGVLMVLQLLQALKTKFKIDTDNINKSMQEFEIPGRFQILTAPNSVILDVAHNCQAARVLAGNLQLLPNGGDIHIVIGMLQDKDQKGVLDALMKVADCWHTVTIATQRGSSSMMLKEKLLELETKALISRYETVADALFYLEDKVNKHDHIVVTGSFLSVGAAMQYLQI